MSLVTLVSDTDSTLAESFRYCQRLARRSGQNFYFSFLTLPRPLFRDMCALYAFMRITDDLGDDPTRSIAQRKAALASWRGELEAVLAGERASHPVAEAVADVQRRRKIPPDYLRAVITGVESDLKPVGFATFAQLRDYCFHVAGAVGLCCIHIWGFADPDAPQRAIDCGLAFQLTNILRDLGEDARAGRIYLPEDELARFSYTADDLRQGIRDERFRNLMRFQVERAREYYDRGIELHAMVDPPGRPMLSAMIGIYGRLLRTIERRGYDVFAARVSVPLPVKLAIAARHLLRPGRKPIRP